MGPSVSAQAAPNRPAVSFRRATEADALCIGVLATQVFLDTYATEGVRASLAREVHQKFATKAIRTLVSSTACTFILAEASQHLVGFAQLTFGASQTLVSAQAPVELDRLYVLARFTGIGLGKALLRQAEALAASSGASALWLTAWAGNERALAFYPAQGYRDVGATTYAFGGDEYENRVFAKVLCAASAG